MFSVKILTWEWEASLFFNYNNDFEVWLTKTEKKLYDFPTKKCDFFLV